MCRNSWASLCTGRTSKRFGRHPLSLSDGNEHLTTLLLLRLLLHLDAITASLSALRNRAQLYPYLSLLCDASKAWKTQLEANASSSAPDALRGISSLAPILDIAAAKTHRVHPFRHDLLSSTGGHDREPFRRTQPPVTPLEDPPSSETVASWAIACGLSDREVEQIKSLCSYALAGSSEVHGDDAAGDDVGRSVRTL